MGTYKKEHEPKDMRVEDLFKEAMFLQLKKLVTMDTTMSLAPREKMEPGIYAFKAGVPTAMCNKEIFVGRVRLLPPSQNKPIPY